MDKDSALFATSLKAIVCQEKHLTLKLVLVSVTNLFVIPILVWLSTAINVVLAETALDLTHALVEMVE
jgi:hypothetical protein